MRNSDSAIPIALAGGLAQRTDQRAKHIGGPFVATSYRKAKALAARALADALNRWGVSQRRLATAARVDQRLVRAWIDPDGANGLRLDVALAIVLDGPEECRGAVVDALRAVLALAEDT